MKKYQIFISSTYIDLIDERQAAVEAILQAGHIPAGMELFAASNQSQWEIIKKWIDESDIYMLILGGRYGSIEQKSELSYTELEYNYACEIGKPLFALVLHKEFIELKVQKQGSTNILELDEPQKLKSFNKTVLSKLCKICKDSKDIQLGVFQSISSLERENDLTGWIKADTGLNAQPYLDQITALQSEKDALKKENSRLQKSKPNDQSTNDFEEVIDALSKEKVSLRKIKTSDNNYPDTMSLLDAFIKYKDALVVGGTSAISTNSFNSFIFHDLSPKLQIFGLMHMEKVSNSSTVRRSILTQKGQNLLAYILKNNH